MSTTKLHNANIATTHVVPKKRLAVFISGNGSNLQALIDACQQNSINGDIALVISDNEKAYGLTRAKLNTIDTHVVQKQHIETIIPLLQAYRIDGIVLAGFLTILPEQLIKHYRHRIINIHPSLVPAFCGKAFYGQRVHQAVFEKGVRFTGATTHFVDEGVDTGPIILQRVVALSCDDTPETIAQKVLQLEHPLLIQTVQLFCQNRLSVENNRVIIPTITDKNN